MIDRFERGDMIYNNGIIYRWNNGDSIKDNAENCKLCNDFCDHNKYSEYSACNECPYYKFYKIECDSDDEEAYWDLWKENKCLETAIKMRDALQVMLE